MVWEPILANDAKKYWDPKHISDGRAVQYWDEDNTVGKWFTKHIESCTSLGDVAWDSYYLFDGKATWDADSLGPMLGCGAPVINDAEALGEAVAKLLAD